MFSWTGNQPLNFLNLASPKTNKINLNDSYEKINEAITNIYGKCKEKKPSISKNADLIKRMKNRFEKGGKILDEKYNSGPSLNSLRFRNSSKVNERGSVTDNWNKFDKKIFGGTENNLNSDILRLELMNLNCYSQKDINSIRGVEKFANTQKVRRTKSTISDLNNL